MKIAKLDEFVHTEPWDGDAYMTALHIMQDIGENCNAIHQFCLQQYHVSDDEITIKLNEQINKIDENKQFDKNVKYNSKNMLPKDWQIIEEYIACALNESIIWMFTHYQLSTKEIKADMIKNMVDSAESKKETEEIIKEWEQKHIKEWKEKYTIKKEEK